jgi:hypothetical protein
MFDAYSPPKEDSTFIRFSFDQSKMSRNSMIFFGEIIPFTAGQKTLGYTQLRS